MSDLATWIIVIATCVSSWAAWAMWKVSKHTLELQHTIEESKTPLVQIWFDNSYQSFEGIVGQLTFINLGKEALPIRTLSFLYGNPENRIQSAFSENLINSTFVTNKMNYSDSQDDLILKNNKIIKLTLLSNNAWPNKFKIRAMYYDNTFEFVEIDTSNLGGKYILTGQGKK